MLSLIALLVSYVAALDNGLARTPALGFNPWNAYGCNINEAIILENAHALVKSGLRDLGYKYLVMDDCWALKQRSASGKLVPDPVKFPNGIKSLSDKIHSMGLLFGMYADAGVMTCGQYPGSLGYEKEDAALFASWGVDYLKYDNCYNQGLTGSHLSFERYKAMSDALNATGRPILYSMCNWGENYTPNWATTIANSFRISGDVGDTFDRYDSRCPCETFECESIQGNHCSFMNIIEKVAPYGQKAHVSFICVCKQLTLAWRMERYGHSRGRQRWRLGYRIQDTIQSLGYQQVAAPSWQQARFHDARNARYHRQCRSHRNKSRCKRPTCFSDMEEASCWYIWQRSIVVGRARARCPSGCYSQRDARGVSISFAVCQANIRMRVNASFADIFLDRPECIQSAFHVRDLWLHKHLGIRERSIVATVPAHGTALFKLTPALQTHSDLK